VTSELIERSNRLGSDPRNTNDEMVAAFDYCLWGKGGRLGGRGRLFAMTEEKH
jgi:hypothetical protein